MNVQFSKVIRTSENSVDVTYLVNGVELTVEWNRIHGGTGEVLDYDLQIDVKCEDADLRMRAEEAIREGETDENPDLDLYIDLRDTFDASDCEITVSEMI